MKKFISVLLSLLMVFSLCLSVSADDGKVAKIGDIKYSTLQEAINVAGNGDTIALIANTNEDVVIESGKDITINIADGVTLTNVSDHTIINKGKLTITGNGIVDNVTNGKAAIYNDLGAIATLNGGTYKRSQETGIDSKNSGGNSYYTIKNYGTMEINSGVTVENKGKYSSLLANGWYSYGNANEPSTNGNPVSKLTINGGTFNGGLNTVKNDDGGEMTINGGTIIGFAQSCVQNNNVLTITGGDIVARENNTDAAIVSRAINNTVNKGITIITGGKVTGSDQCIREDTTYGSTHHTEISGGTFSSDVAKYLKKGLVQNKDGSVVEKTYVASIGDKGFDSLADAINAANNGDTIKVLSSLSLDKGLALKKDITIDLGGNTIEAKGMLFDIYSDVKLKNGTFKGIDFTSAGATIWLNKKASLLVEKDATIEVKSNDGVSSFVIALYNDCDGASLTVNGTLKGENGVTVNGMIKTDNTVNIDGATIDVTGHGLYLAGVATTNISNTNINAGSTAIEIRAGELNIKDGTYTSAGEFKTSPNGNGTTVDGAAIAISQHTTKLPIDVTIDGGSFKGEYSLYEANVQENDEESLANVNIKINDGDFDGKFFIENNAEKSIKGGKYSVDVSKYLISGYNVAKINETYSVVKDGEKISVTSPTPTVDETTYDEVKKVKSDSNGILLETDLVNALQSNEKDMLNKQTPSNSKLDQIVPLDINLYSVDENGGSTKITSLNSPITINMYLPDDIVDSIKNKTIKVARFHGGVLSMLDASLNGNILTFKTDKFSTYAIVAYGTVTPTSNVADKKAGPKDLNSDGVITCDEEMGSKNWIWSESKGACVYKVSNTSVK